MPEKWVFQVIMRRAVKWGRCISRLSVRCHFFIWNRRCSKLQLEPLAILIILKSGFWKWEYPRSPTFACRMGWESVWRWFRQLGRNGHPWCLCRTSLYTTPTACFNKLSSLRKHIFACLNELCLQTQQIFFYKIYAFSSFVDSLLYNNMAGYAWSQNSVPFQFIQRQP